MSGLMTRIVLDGSGERLPRSSSDYGTSKRVRSDTLMELKSRIRRGEGEEKGGKQSLGVICSSQTRHSSCLDCFLHACNMYATYCYTATHNWSRLRFIWTAQGQCGGKDTNKKKIHRHTHSGSRHTHGLAPTPLDFTPSSTLSSHHSSSAPNHGQDG